MAIFEISAPVPFEFKAPSGKVYQVPFVEDMDVKHIAQVGGIVQIEDLEERVNTIKAFILEFCPDLENEPITDMQYIKLFGKMGHEDEDEAGES